MIRKIIMGVLPVCLICAKTHGQNFFYGARIGAFANAGSAISDIGNVSYNPSGFTSIKHPTFSIGYENRFLTKELSVKSAIIAFPIKNNYFGFSFNTTGFDGYKEQVGSMSYAKKLSERFNLGLKFNYHTISITNYGTKSSLSIELGLQAKVSDQLTLATHIVNPTRTNLGAELVNPLETIFRVGALYSFSLKAFITTEVEKSLNYPVNTKFGLEYKPLDLLALRGGISTNPFRQFYGLGITLNKFKIDLAASTHPTLGYSPQLSLGYEF